MHSHRLLSLLSVLAAAVIAAPIATIAIKLFPIDYAVWRHLLDTVLFTYLSHSFMLGFNVLALTSLIAISGAWLCSRCEFPGRRVLEWMLVLPLAYPAYIIAYTYAGMLDYGGTWLPWLNAIGLETPLPVRSLVGASILFSIVFYPYLYLLVRVAWLNHSTQLIEESRVLGATPWQSFRLVSLPAARPAIAVGMAIILMETLAEYGGAHYLGIPTLSVGIFRTWLGMNNLHGAVQLSVVLLFIAVFLFLIERKARVRARYYEVSGGQTQRRYRLRGYRLPLAWFVCFTPPLLGFIVPSVQLLDWSLTAAKDWPDYWSLMHNSLMLALAAALFIAALALLLSYICRLNAADHWSQPFIHASAYGYAVPGTIVVVGVLSLSVLLDRQLESAFGPETSIHWMLSGSVSALILAYTVRFMTLGFKPISACLEKIPPAMDHAARTLAAGPYQTLGLIHWPLMRSGVLSAALLIFVEVIKELPMTMMLRPFNFNTLAVGAYEMAQEGRVSEAALPTLSIVVMGMLPLFVLFKKTRDAVS